MATIKTTLRISEELHRRLKTTAGELRMTSERILEDALQRELDRLNATKWRSDISRDIHDLLELRTSMPSPFLAELFLQSLPAFCVIKDPESKIRWANFFFEETLGVPLAQARNRTIGDVAELEGFERENVERNIEKVKGSREPQEAIEGLTLKNLGTINIRADRFVIPGSNMLGDVSFIERSIRDTSFDVSPDVLVRMQRSARDHTIEELFPPFLHGIPAASALKKPLVSESDSIIVWANEQYVELTRSSNAKTKKVQGQRTSKVFGIDKDHPLFRSEAEVMSTKRARMTKETLPRRKERWSLRFPIFDQSGNVEVIGVISPNFGQKDESNAPVEPPARRRSR